MVSSSRDYSSRAHATALTPSTGQVHLAQSASSAIIPSCHLFLPGVRQVARTPTEQGNRSAGDRHHSLTAAVHNCEAGFNADFGVMPSDGPGAFGAGGNRRGPSADGRETVEGAQTPRVSSCVRSLELSSPSVSMECEPTVEIVEIEKQLRALASERQEHMAQLALQAKLGAQAESLPPLQQQTVLAAMRKLESTTRRYDSAHGERQAMVARLASRVAELQASGE